MPKVLIVPPAWGFHEMFRKYGWEFTSTLDDADLIQFTGGHDIHPRLYGHDVHPDTHYSLDRDAYEVAFFKEAQERKIPMAGVCRGAQLMCALTGGWLWQDVDNHLEHHDVIEKATGEVYQVNSIHHQMMMPTKECEIVTYARESTARERAANGRVTVSMTANHIDVEAVYFPMIKGFGIQCHPEMSGPLLQDRYFRYLEQYLGFQRG